MNPIIKVEGISKSYDISHQGEMKAGYSTLKDDFAKLIKKPFTRNKGDEHETFWALNDISFEINQGEIFGIVGRNGSGKSTLLKILSRIVEPTKGEVRLQGRTASLLEVGTGFHPELTGRENIFFNGSMLGMGRQEIRSKFSEIVEFAEIEKFLDTPVKFYSSGMYVRLAFSIAAHLEPEILILDEVLAVGDAGFQQKSLQKIRSTLKGGRTVIFVSHDMGAIKQLCSRGIILKDGKIDFMGPTDELIKGYLDRNLIRPIESEIDGKVSSVTVTDNMYELSNPKFKFSKISILQPADAESGPSIPFKESFEIEVGLSIKEALKSVRVGVLIQTLEGVKVAIVHNDDSETSAAKDLEPGEYIFKATVKNPLRPGRYVIGAGAHEAIKKGASIFAPTLLSFEVLDKDKHNKPAPLQDVSLITTESQWHLEKLPK
jgi:lipopolysaccharide transport system ATP-binding protein